MSISLCQDRHKAAPGLPGIKSKKALSVQVLKYQIRDRA